MRATVFGLAMGAAAFGGVPAVAASSFTPPKGCHLTLTAQLHGCRVENHYTCDGDPAGDQRISFSDEQGEYYVSRIDAETRWIASVSVETGEADALDVEGSADNASFTTLLATGRDDYDFVVESSDGETRRYVGYDRLTGQTTAIDGVPLERTEFSMRITDGDGQLIGTRKGTELVSREMRVFFGDRETFTDARGADAGGADAGGAVAPDVSTPVTFARPGEEGFAAAAPIFDCDMMMSTMSPTPHHPTL